MPITRKVKNAAVNTAEERIVNETQHQVTNATKPSNWSHTILKIIVLLVWIFTFACFAFGYINGFAQIFGQEQNIKGWANAFPWFLLFSGIMSFIFLYLVDKLNLSNLKDSSNLIITNPEKQYNKIRDWAREHHGLELRNCIRVGRSPQPSAGESSTLPHTLHFLFEVYRGGIKVGFTQIDNSLFKKTDVFWLMNDCSFFRNTKNSYWWGDNKDTIPVRLMDTSAGNRNFKVLSQDDIEDLDQGSATE